MVAFTWTLAFSVFCWVMGIVYGFLALLIRFGGCFNLFWHGPSVVRDAGARFACTALICLLITTSTMAYLCLKVTSVEQNTPKWIALNLTAVIFSFVTVVPMVAYCWFLRHVPDDVYWPAGITASIWIVQVIFAWRTYRRFAHDKVSERDRLDDD